MTDTNISSCGRVRSRKLAIVTFFMVAIVVLSYVFYPFKIENTLLDAPPWGVSLSQLREIKAKDSETFKISQGSVAIFDDEPHHWLEVTETLFGCQFRAFYYFRIDDDRLLRISYITNKKTSNEETIRQLPEQIKRYIDSTTELTFFNSCEDASSYRIGNTNVSDKEYATIWRYRGTYGALRYMIGEKPGVGSASLSFTLFDSNNIHNVAAMKKKGRAVCFKPVGW